MFWIMFASVLAADFFSKTYIRANYALGETKCIIGNILRFTHWTNSGAAFGLLQGATPYLAVVSAGSIALALFLQPKVKEHGPIVSIALGLIAGGTLGNLIDRVRFGKVTDFVSVCFFSPIFNVADAAIVTGAILLGAFFVFILKEPPEQ